MISKRKIYLAEPRGFCAGVIRAVQIVKDMLKKHGSPVYVRHEIVHNKYVVDSFRKAGVVFIEDLATIPKGSTVIFSAHGISPEVEKQADAMGLKYIDATCPLVKKIHKKALKLKKEGYTIILIGDKDHPELIGTLGHLNGDAIVIESVEDAAKLSCLPALQSLHSCSAIPEESEKITYMTQTTLSPEDVEDIVTALKKRLPQLRSQEKNDICYATLERQAAIKKLAEKCDVILVLGSHESSNSNRLTQTAIKAGAEAYLIDSYTDIPDAVLKSAGNIGITAGASAPEILVKQTVEFLQKKDFDLAAP